MSMGSPLNRYLVLPLTRLQDVEPGKMVELPMAFAEENDNDGGDRFIVGLTRDELKRPTLVYEVSNGDNHLAMKVEPDSLAGAVLDAHYSRYLVMDPDMLATREDVRESLEPIFSASVQPILIKKIPDSPEGIDDAPHVPAEKPLRFVLGLGQAGDEGTPEPLLVLTVNVEDRWYTQFLDLSQLLSGWAKKAIQQAVADGYEP